MREFNTTGLCVPEYHYMVDIEQRLKEMKRLVDNQKYFVINRARQYGKTTTLYALEKYLSNDYLVVSMDFQRQLSHAAFETEQTFSTALAYAFLESLTDQNALFVTKSVKSLKDFVSGKKEEIHLVSLFRHLNSVCAESVRPIVLVIDEVDSASNNQIFLDFLAQLRGYYLNRFRKKTFHCVILAGLYDIKNLKTKIRPEDQHKLNSPWNIAVDFEMDMSFSAKEIIKMLTDYEEDMHTGMNLSDISQLLYDYTAGYPVLVSKLCKLIDEELPKSEKYQSLSDAWTKEGFLDAERILLNESNTLFESMVEKLAAYPELKNMILRMLFTGEEQRYNPDTDVIQLASRGGWLTRREGRIEIANRIFETRLYNLFLSEAEMRKNGLYQYSISEKNQFVVDGYLDMRKILEKFTEHFQEIYGSCGSKFVEENGTRFFLLYIRPIINGSGNYYVEAQTRDRKRTDIIIDYHHEQYIIEVKIWHGEEYNRRGELQLKEYLDYYHKDKGYMISFNFNQKKNTGVHEVIVGNKTILEAVI